MNRFAQYAAGVALALSSFASLAQGLTRADRPELQQNDTWIYQSTDLATGEKRRPATHRLLEISDDKIIVRSGSETRTYTRDWNLVEAKRGETVTLAFDPAWPYYKFPIEVGKQWDARFNSTSRGGARSTRWQWNARVEGLETVTVPAGTFETFKIKFDAYYNGSEGMNSWTGRRTETLWYAPAVKRHVKSEFEEVSGSYRNVERVELMSFKPGQRKGSASTKEPTAAETEASGPR